ncbi:hypothetical protein BpHYR1_050214 [Brachionus plicatilis]|uniref:Uncharacterized protein n=1 Tax=Brachionus plicatilis TaxID=10195 RepID=A0A3M7QE40_BRAPC|nr:hypothetical protein BpHYR1_050214 [Brachionus plicatilis]
MCICSEKKNENKGKLKGIFSCVANHHKDSPTDYYDIQYGSFLFKTSLFDQSEILKTDDFAELVITLSSNALKNEQMQNSTKIYLKFIKLFSNKTIKIEYINFIENWKLECCKLQY